jgi:poly(ADP-ribose) glycohydrolase ARH3
MMIAVAESWIRTGGVSRDDLLASLAENYDPARGYGHGMRSFLRWAPDFASVVTNTILAGGDTDTTAAMSGALCGALVGEEAIPSDWINRIEKGPRGGSYVAGLAERTFGFWHHHLAY